MRHELIRAELARSGGVRIRDLVNSLGVSRATVRRDLHALVDAGEAVNARGGALLPVDRAHGVAALEHEAIARAAADLIAADNVKHLGLFGGPLVSDLARRLAGRPDLHVVTNSLAIARSLAAPDPRLEAQAHRGPQVTLLSGSVSPAGTMLGGLATDALATLRLDASYFDCSGYDARFGAAVDDLYEADLRRSAVAVSDRCVLLVEQAQLGASALSTFITLRDIYAVIRNGRREFSPRVRHQLKQTVA
jgi:DeoR/GlpR family transcriptional regulator of sugar metabolism